MIHVKYQSCLSYGFEDGDVQSSFRLVAMVTIVVHGA